MKRLNIGVIGCGDIAGYTALLGRLIPQIRFSACCDVNPDCADAFSRRHHIPFQTTEYETLLQRDDVQAVYLAVPHDLHYGMILAAVEAGKPVLVEKPLVRTLAEGRDLLARIGGNKVGVNYQYRYDRGCYQLYETVRSGALGSVYSVRINIPWHRSESYFSSSAWHASKSRAGGGTLITQGSHFLDVVLWMLGEEPVSAVGEIASPGFDVEVETLAHGVVKTDAGTLISITSSMVAASEGAVTIEVYGERGTAVYSDKPLPRVRFHGVRVRRVSPPVRGVHALQRSLAGFARWILHDQPYLIPAQEALPALAAVDLIYRSAQAS
jgi:UDP-N-acetyl-2-amino-2-deoxyglucuronate dehydrogenase